MIELMDPAHAKAFAERLNRALARIDLPGKYSGRHVMLAKMMGVSVRTASNWLNGEKLPGADRMIDLAETTGVCVDWLWVGKGPMMAEDLPTDAEAAIINRLRQLAEDDRSKVIQILDVLTPPQRSS